MLSKITIAFLLILFPTNLHALFNIDRSGKLFFFTGVGTVTIYIYFFSIKLKLDVTIKFIDLFNSVLLTSLVLS